jgi:hypothetical protein
VRGRFRPAAGFILPPRVRVSVAAPASPSPEPWVLHDTLLELLKRLNQSHNRAGDEGVDGLEFAEVQRAMSTFWSTRLHQVDLTFALQLLVENGLVRAEDRPAYAWDRGRVLGQRFLITTNGKSYLQGALNVTGRVP